MSGYRPQSRGSQHQTARALDLRVAGVRNEELVAFCKTLTDTACGYYPNSSFVHVDVRNPGTGSVTWIDASGPHEAPRYVKQWPPPPEEPANAKPADDKVDSDKADPAVAPEPHDLTADPWEIDRDLDEPTSALDAPAPRPSATFELRKRLTGHEERLVQVSLVRGAHHAELLLEVIDAVPQALVLRGERADHLRHGIGEVRVIERRREARVTIRPRRHDARGHADDRRPRRHRLHHHRSRSDPAPRPRR